MISKSYNVYINSLKDISQGVYCETLNMTAPYLELNLLHNKDYLIN